ncbi:hypothetical protein BH11CYA1_BH11CYA1_25810 [soil metagenome]
MFDIRLVFILVLSAIVVLGIGAFLITSVYRSHMAPRVREAMNAAYDDVEFLRINHLPQRCDGETLYRLEAAFAMFRDAKNSLDAGRYKRTVELAKQASATIRSLRSRLVCREQPMPVPPSLRIISSPDCLVWMGK